MKELLIPTSILDPISSHYVLATEAVASVSSFLQKQIWNVTGAHILQSPTGSPCKKQWRNYI